MNTESSRRFSDLGEARVSDLRLRDCVTVSSDEPAEKAVERMIRHDRGAVVVVDATGRTIGIFSERDVLELETKAIVQGGTDWRRTEIAQVMTPDPVVVGPSATVKEALQKMREGGFRHLPVVDPADARPLGLLSVRDILNYVAQYFESELQNLPPDPALEAKSPWGA